MEIEIFTGSYGFDITLSTGLNLTTTTEFILKIKNPKGVLIQKNIDTETFLTPLTDGKFVYTVEPSDFIQPGTYNLQAFDITDGSKKLASTITKVKVKPSVEYIEI